MAGIVSQLMDAVSGLFLTVLGTEMTVMEEYFPFLTVAFRVMQYTAWALLFLMTAWQLFRSFGGPLTESEHPMQLIARSVIFAVLIGFSKPVFMLALDIARAPYTALMDLQMSAEDFTFAGVEEILQSGITTLVSVITIVGLILLLILEISLGWNYFKLLLETVERYIVVGVLCYTSPLAYCMGGTKATGQVFKSWCRMVGSQLLLLVLNVWFLRAFNSSVGQFMVNAGALSGGGGNIFLWLFCALAFLKTAQKFDNYLAALGLNVAQTGSSMAVEMIMAARVLTGIGGGAKSASSAIHNSSPSSAAAASTGGFMAGLSNLFKGNSYVRDAVVNGGARMGAGGGMGFVGRTFGAMAARNGATLTGESIASVAGRSPGVSGAIAGDIADRSLKNYMPQLDGFKLSSTQINGGHISTVAEDAAGKTSNIEMYNAAQFEKPEEPHSIVTASDGSQWYQMAQGDGYGSFYSTPQFSGSQSETEQVSAAFPEAEDGTLLRTVGEGMLAASSDSGDTSWYNSAFFDEPDAPHSIISDANGVDWYAMEPRGMMPEFEPGSDEGTFAYNRASFQSFMPGYETQVSQVDGEKRSDGQLEVRHNDGSGTAFYDTSLYGAPRGDYKVYEDKDGHQWYAVSGESSVERKPIYKDGRPVYQNNGVKSVNVESVKYKTTPNRYGEVQRRDHVAMKPPRRKN